MDKGLQFTGSENLVCRAVAIVGLSYRSVEGRGRGPAEKSGQECDGGMRGVAFRWLTSVILSELLGFVEGRWFGLEACSKEGRTHADRTLGSTGNSTELGGVSNLLVTRMR